MNKPGRAFRLLALFLILSVAAVLALYKRVSQETSIVNPLGQRSSEQEISLTADAYYIDGNEPAYDIESTYIEGENAGKVSQTLSGKYKAKNETEIIEEYLYVVSPVYIGRSIDEIDRYSVNTETDTLSDEIYGDSIYIIDSKTIGIWSYESQMCWIAKKAEGEIDINLLDNLLDSGARPSEEVIEELVQPGSFDSEQTDLSEEEDIPAENFGVFGEDGDDFSRE